MEVIVIGAFAMIIALIALCTVWLFRFHRRYLVWEDLAVADPVDAKPNFPVEEQIFGCEDDRGKELNLTTGLRDGQTQLGGEKWPLPEEGAVLFLKTVESDAQTEQVLPEECQTAMVGLNEKGESPSQTRETDVAAEDSPPPAELVGMTGGTTQPETGFLGRLEASAHDKKKTTGSCRHRTPLPRT